MTAKEREKYKRPAFEGYVDSKDIWYWNRTKELIEDVKEKTSKLVGVSLLVFGIFVILSDAYFFHKFWKLSKKLP